jgi:hypothetical protein
MWHSIEMKIRHCRECQVQDWKRHRVECAHLASLGLWAKPYDLSDHPCGGCFDRVNNIRAQLREDRCNICGATEDLVKTECCGITLCDTEYKNYQMMSYNREFCHRSHTRYTKCGGHHTNDHETKLSGGDDYRNCGRCRAEIDADRSARWCVAQLLQEHAVLIAQCRVMLHLPICSLAVARCNCAVCEHR